VIIKVSPLRCGEELCDGELVVLGVSGEHLWCQCVVCGELSGFKLVDLLLYGPPKKTGGNGEVEECTSD